MALKRTLHLSVPCFLDKLGVGMPALQSCWADWTRELNGRWKKGVVQQRVAPAPRGHTSAVLALLLYTCYLQPWVTVEHLIPSLSSSFDLFDCTAQHTGSLTRSQGSNMHPLQWKCGVLTAGPPWKPLISSLVAQRVKRLPTMQETRFQSLGREDPLEKEMAPHSSILAWKIPWTEESGRLQSMGSQRVRHDWATSLSLSVILKSEGKISSLSLPGANAWFSNFLNAFAVGFCCYH